MRILWSDTAPAGPVLPAIAEPLACDVLVAGGGYTGLSAALHLAEAGADVALLEADVVGAYASGRNGGQVVPGLKPDPDALAGRFGATTAERMLRIARDAADQVFRLVERHRIDCAAARNGWIQAAYSARSLALVEARARMLQRSGARVDFLARSDMASATGSRFHHGGMIERDAGSVQPLAYAHGLARAASLAGARLFERSRVEHLRSDQGRWVALANGQPVIAKNVVLATEAYTGALWPAVTQSMVNVTSAQIATEPLPADLLRTLIPSRAGVSETRKITYYYRIDPQGRFVIGGRGPLSDTLTDSTRDAIRKAAVARYPALAGVAWTHGWSCRVGMTIDDLPHLHELAPGLWTAYGYCGRGVALATKMGEVLAAKVMGRMSDATDYPVTPLRRIPLQPLHQPLAAALITWHRLRDALGFPA